MYCHNCGAEVNEGDVYCGECGAKLRVGGPPATWTDENADDVAGPEDASDASGAVEPAQGGSGTPTTKGRFPVYIAVAFLGALFALIFMFVLKIGPFSGPGQNKPDNGSEMTVSVETGSDEERVATSAEEEAMSVPEEAESEEAMNDPEETESEEKAVSGPEETEPEYYVLVVELHDSTDDSLISDAKVTYMDEEGNTYVTNIGEIAGEYRRALKPGAYTVIIEKDGYKTIESEVEDLSEDTRITCNIEKNVSFVGEYIGEFNGVTTYNLHVYSQEGNTLDVMLDWYNMRMAAGTDRVYAELDGTILQFTAPVSGGHGVSGEESFRIEFSEDAGTATLVEGDDSVVMYRQ